MIMSQLINKMGTIMTVEGEGAYFRFYCQRCRNEYQSTIPLPVPLADEILLMAISDEDATHDLHNCSDGSVGVSNVIGYDLKGKVEK